MTKAVKVTDELLEDLNDIKLRMPEEYTGEITGCNVIEFLACYYDEHTDPEFLRKKQQILEKNYVTKEQYEKAIEENRESYEEDKKTINFLQEELTKSFAVEENLNIQLQKLKDANMELSAVLTDKDKKINEMKNNTELLNQSYVEICDKHHNLTENYNSNIEEYKGLREYINQRCIEINDLDYLLTICRFLFKHKKRWFSVEEIHETVYDLRVEEIREVLKLSEFDIFPVIQGQSKRGDIFKYDPHHLRIPLAQVLGFQ